MTEDSQQVWADYYARIRRRRIAETKILHSQMSADGVNDDTVLALDFLHSGPVERDVRSLAEQLSEHYSMNVALQADGDYWNAVGTTRPEGIDGMNLQRCVDWVTFMCDVANSYGCVFLTWRLTDPAREEFWTNETIDVDPEVGD